jgi:hypothetical protein
MIGSFNNDRNHYRCTYAAEYADTNASARSAPEWLHRA